MEEYGAMQKKSGYKHNVDLPIQVVDKNHPVTAGLSDFTLHDETYSNYLVQPDVHVLLKTDHPTSTPALAWTRAQAIDAGRSGCGPGVAANPAYQGIQMFCLILNPVQYHLENLFCFSGELIVVFHQ